VFVVRIPRKRHRLEHDEDFVQPIPLAETGSAESKAEFLAQLRDFQWSHRLPEKTLADMLEMMKQGHVRDYIRSGAEMPHRHTEVDKILQAEVSVIPIFYINFDITNSLYVGWCRSSHLSWMPHV